MNKEKLENFFYNGQAFKYIIYLLHIISLYMVIYSMNRISDTSSYFTAVILYITFLMSSFCALINIYLISLADLVKKFKYQTVYSTVCEYVNKYGYITDITIVDFKINELGDRKVKYDWKTCKLKCHPYYYSTICPWKNKTDHRIQDNTLRMIMRNIKCDNTDIAVDEKPERDNVVDFNKYRKK